MEQSYTETTGDPGMGHLDPAGMLTVEQVLAYTKSRDQALYDLAALAMAGYNGRSADALRSTVRSIDRKLNTHNEKVKLGNELIAAQPFV